MRNIRLVDACIATHEIAKIIEEEIGKGGLSEVLRSCADRIHDYSIIDNRVSEITKNVINKAKA